MIVDTVMVETVLVEAEEYGDGAPNTVFVPDTNMTGAGGRGW